jgi:hypothetical protein
MSLGGFCERLAELPRGARGHKMAYVIERINPVLRGWARHFEPSQSKRPLARLASMEAALDEGTKPDGLKARRRARLQDQRPMAEAHGGPRERHT